ncbi:MAG: methionine adenosyltransferase, partial [Candidatus Eisenbacteria bacterium]|nr:methionine adenosyltransferase [Candidatus Eisenbacteria bacterium]
MRHRTLITSESVTAGHPDKVADQISDAVLDAIIAEDPRAHVACETLVTTGMALVSGEISTHAWADIPDIVRQTLRSIGYDDPAYGFDWETCAVMTTIDKQSPDINQGVERANPEEQGAGDQGIMFGYATEETDVLMPLPIQLAHQLAQRLEAVRISGELPYLGPDGKSQVTIEYENGRPCRVDTVVISAQHRPEAAIEQIRADIERAVIRPLLPPDIDATGLKLYINRTGRFVYGGPAADTGLTGRKIIVDTYGGLARHGGGAFSGKDPSKVDRSAAYAARWVAKSLVAAGGAERCEVQLGYCIGHPEPVSIHCETFGTERVDPAK